MMQGKTSFVCCWKAERVFLSFASVYTEDSPARFIAFAQVLVSFCSRLSFSFMLVTIASAKQDKAVFLSLGL